MTVWGRALLFRSGGYSWNGQISHRPPQVIDWASEEYVDRPVPGASAAAAALAAGPAGPADPEQSSILQIEEVDLDASPVKRRRHHLAFWAPLRAGPPSALRVRGTAPTGGHQRRLHTVRDRGRALCRRPLLAMHPCGHRR